MMELMHLEVLKQEERFGLCFWRLTLKWLEGVNLTTLHPPPTAPVFFQKIDLLKVNPGFL